jgi:hypothetical protein
MKAYEYTEGICFSRAEFKMKTASVLWKCQFVIMRMYCCIAMVWNGGARKRVTFAYNFRSVTCVFRDGHCVMAREDCLRNGKVVWMDGSGQKVFGRCFIAGVRGLLQVTANTSTKCSPSGA